VTNLSGNQNQRPARKITKSPLTAIHEDQSISEDELSFSREDHDSGQASTKWASDPVFDPDLEGTREDDTANSAFHEPTDRIAAVRDRALQSPLASQGSRTPAPQSKPSSNRTQASNIRKRNPTNTGNMVDVTVYRRSRRPQADTDPLGATQIPSLNPADVLAQITSEMSSTYIAGSTTASARQRRLLLAFENTLHDALFDISAAQNAVHALTGRLRKVKRENGDIRAELLRVKAEREEIGRRMDSVRSKHSQRVQAEEDRRHLVEGVHDLDIALQRGRESMRETGSAVDGFDGSPGDLLIATVQLVQNKGLVGAVRDMNAFLNGAADLLDGH
jgi:hypothetical protein